jgi:sRNA-binding regulator protein Hfq
MANRKLIRPDLTDFKGKPAPRPVPHAKSVPPDHTNAEAFYYSKQMAARTPMVVVLKDGEKLHGVIEWYDRDCIKVNRHDGPNLLVPKHSIKYMYKENEENDVSGEGHRAGWCARMRRPPRPAPRAQSRN